MKTNHDRRLVRLNELLGRPRAKPPREPKRTLLDVPTLADAVARAAEAGASHVLFAPTAGPVQEAAVPQAGDGRERLALAFEGLRPTPNQMRRMLKRLDPTAEVTDCGTKIGGYSRHDGYVAGTVCRECGEIIDKRG